jgi:hypothetical protein
MDGFIITSRAAEQRQTEGSQQGEGRAVGKRPARSAGRVHVAYFEPPQGFHLGVVKAVVRRKTHTYTQKDLLSLVSESSSLNFDLQIV